MSKSGIREFACDPGTFEGGADGALYPNSANRSADIETEGENNSHSVGSGIPCEQVEFYQLPVELR
jgi:hypothetical protein